MQSSPPSRPPATQRLGPIVLWTAITIAVAAFVWVTVGPGNGPSATVAIEWSSDVVEMIEGDPDVVLTARLAEPLRTGVSISIRLDGPRAGDVVVEPSEMFIPAGELEGSVRLSLPDDSELQGSSTLEVVLEPTDGVEAPDPVATLVVVDDEDLVPPTSSTTTTTSTLPPSTTVLPPSTEITPALLATDVARATSTVTTPVIEFEPDRLVLVALSFLTREPATAIPEVTGAGLEWEVVATQTRQDGPRRLTVYRAMPTSATSGALEINLNQTAELALWMVMDFDGTETGANGANAIGQVNGNNAGGLETSARVRMFPYESPTNASLGVFFAGVTGLDGEPGYIEVGEQETRLRTLATYFSPQPDDVIETAEWETRAHWIAIAMELKPRSG